MLRKRRNARLLCTGYMCTGSGTSSVTRPGREQRLFIKVYMRAFRCVTKWPSLVTRPEGSRVEVSILVLFYYSAQREPS